MSTAFSTSDPIPCVEELGHSTEGRSRSCSAFTLQQNIHLSASQLNPREVDGALMRNRRCQLLQELFLEMPRQAVLPMMLVGLSRSSQAEKQIVLLPCLKNDNESNSHSNVSISYAGSIELSMTHLRSETPKKFFSILQWPSQ